MHCELVEPAAWLPTLKLQPLQAQASRYTPGIGNNRNTATAALCGAHSALALYRSNKRNCHSSDSRIRTPVSRVLTSRLKRRSVAPHHAHCASIMRSQPPPLQAGFALHRFGMRMVGSCRVAPAAFSKTTAHTHESPSRSGFVVSRFLRSSVRRRSFKFGNVLSFFITFHRICNCMRLCPSCR